MLTRRLSLPNRFDFASGGRLQQRELVACGFLRVKIALPLVLNPQATPFIRIDSLEIGSLELAIGGGLR